MSETEARQPLGEAGGAATGVKTRPASARVTARRGFLALSLLSAAAILAIAVDHLRAIRIVAPAIDRGQAEELTASVRGELGRLEGRPTAEQLNAVAVRLAPLGVVALTLLDSLDLQPLVSTPNASRAPLPDPLPLRSLETIGERRRFVERPPPRLGAPALPAPRPDRELIAQLPGLAPPRPGRPPPSSDAVSVGGNLPYDARRVARPHPVLVLEFTPTAYLALTRRAGWQLSAGVATAALLLLGAGALWILLGREERLAERRERDGQLQVLGEMASVLAHELRNPLASLKGNAQLLARRLARSGGDSAKADLLVAEVGRLEGLCENLLSFSRVGPLWRERTDPAELVREVCERSGALCRVDETAAPKSWSLDGPRLGQALDNLVRNAREASPPEVPIEVTVERRGADLRIAVRDHGRGLPPGEEERIFDAFFTRKPQGTGLGLAVARRIVELHGGALTAGHAEGGGAVFALTIPEG